MYETSIAVIGVGILFFIGILATQLDQKHAMLKMFFLIMGLWFSVGLLNISQLVVTDNSGSSGVFDSLVVLYWVMIIISFLTTFYFVMYYLETFIDQVKEKKKEKQKDRLGYG